MPGKAEIQTVQDNLALEIEEGGSITSFVQGILDDDFYYGDADSPATLDDVLNYLVENGVIAKQDAAEVAKQF